MGWSVQIPRRRGGKALWSAGRQWPAVSPRYGGRVCAPAQIQVEPRTVLFALSRYSRLRAFLFALGHEKNLWSWQGGGLPPPPAQNMDR